MQDEMKKIHGLEASLQEQGTLTEVGQSEELSIRKESAEVSNLIIDGETKDIAPHAEVIAVENEQVDPKKIPSIARMANIQDKDELIWLTKKAVEDRLEVLLHTDPRFNRKPSEAAAAYREVPAGLWQETIDENHKLVGEEQHGHLDPMRVFSVQANTREGMSDEEMSEVLQTMGFRLVKGQNSEPVILVDATVPAKDNTAGRFTKTGKTTVKNAHGKVKEQTGIISQDPDRVGFRPATEQSETVIAIPWSKVLELHHEPGAIEYNSNKFPRSLLRGLLPKYHGYMSEH